ncbi:MAG: ABC transporter substrate-binding protein [Deltaproteobacteria bacterium]|nr:ABC transporter substrate-binding protein [Deltaproteobacteria bacterium]
MVLIAVLASMTMALLGWPAAVLAEETIKIGVVCAMSPPGDAASGAELRKGFELAKRIVDERGGIPGKQIQLVYEDSQGIPEKGRAAVEKLITQDKVAVITGEHHSSVGLAEIEVAHRYHIPYVNTNCWADAMRLKGYSEVFNVCINNSAVGKAAAEIIAAMNVKKVVGFAENTDYGLGKAKEIKGYLEKIAPQVSFEYVVIERDAKDFLPILLPLKKDPPDMVVNIMLAPSAFMLMNQVYEQGLAPTKKTWFFDSVGVAGVPDFWNNVGEAAKYMIVFELFHPSMQFTPSGQKLREYFFKQEGHDPNMQPLQAADSYFVIAEALKKAGSADPDKLIPALADLKMEGTRDIITFAKEPGLFFQQWVNVPYVAYQITAVKQPKDKTNLLVGPGLKFSTDKLQRPE